MFLGQWWKMRFSHRVGWGGEWDECGGRDGGDVVGEMVAYLSALRLLSRVLARSAGARGLVMR